MSDPSRGELFERLADTFLARLRRGERPDPAEYAQRHPRLAQEILELFPALVEIEGLKLDAERSHGSAFHGSWRGLDSKSPERLGDYRILKVIGAGGMGVVYEAERESLKANVALKVLHPRWRDDPSFRGRFRNEARSAARLHHSNIVSVFDFGEADGTLFCVMQYIRGQGLDRVLDEVRRLRDDPPAAARTSPDPLAETIARSIVGGSYESGADPSVTALPVTEKARDVPAAEVGISPSSSQVTMLAADQVRYHREIARIGAMVADALAYAHGRGVVHRDVKPSNLLLDAQGTAWVTDFGLAKFDESENLTETGDVVGTLRYLAPERFEGRSDARCDIYALGVTLYEALALRPAFHGGDRAGLIRRILTEEPKPLRLIDPRISRDLETVVHKAMARNPSDRYADAAALAAELRRVVENRPIRSRRISPHEQFWRWCRRNPATATLIALAAAATVACAVVSTTAALRLGRSNAEVSKSLERAKTAERERTEQLVEANLAQARAERLTRRPGQRFDSLAALKRAATLVRELSPPADLMGRLRHEAIAALAQPDIRAEHEFGQWSDEILSVDLNDDFDLYCTCDRQGRCIVRRVADDSIAGRLPDVDGPRRANFGAGRWLVDRDDKSRRLRVWDLSRLDSPVVRIEVEDARCWDCRPDGRAFVVGRLDGTLSTYELPGGNLRRRAPSRGIVEESFVRLHPSAPYVVESSFRSNFITIQSTESDLSLELTPPGCESGVGYCNWSMDGRRLAAPLETQKLAIYQFDAEGPTADLLRTFPHTNGLGLHVAFNADGERLFVRGWTNAMAMFETSGVELFRARPDSPLSSRPMRLDRARSRLGPSRLEDRGVRLGISSIAEGRECRTLRPSTPRGGFSQSHVSPEGRLATAVSVHDRVMITLFDLATGRDVGTIVMPKGVTLNTEFSPSGELLTNTSVGCFSWPVRKDPAAPDGLVVGPPERLRLNPGVAGIAASRDGRVVAQSMNTGFGMQPYFGGWILHRDKDAPARHVEQGRSTGGPSVSPDGRWVAFDAGTLRVYDAESGEPAWTAPSGQSRFLFSPDGRWLATGLDGGRLYEVGTWKPGPRLGAGAIECFAGDGATAVLCTNGGLYRLVETATGRELATIECLDHFPRISPDGSKLVVGCNEGLRVWDLRLIRERLSELGLDWDAPSLPPPTPAAGPLSVRIVGAGLIDPKTVAAIDTLRAIVAVAVKGRRAGAVDHLAMARVWSGMSLFDLALRDYDEALRLGPGLLEARRARGFERFRRGEWEAAVADFSAALVDGDQDEASRILLRRSWAHHALGRESEAVADLSTILGRAKPTGSVRAACLTLRAEYERSAGRAERAEADLADAGSIGPSLADSLNEFLWPLLVQPPERRADPIAARLARKAYELAPEDRLIANTVGLALYRNGEFADAAEVLAKNLRRAPDTTEGFDLAVMAMCRIRLGQPAQAAECYQRAFAWVSRAELEFTSRGELETLLDEVRHVLVAAKTLD